MNGVKRPGGPSGISAPGQGVRVTNTGLKFPGDGVRPQRPGFAPSQNIPESTASWPGLPGKAGPDRANGINEEKVYVFAQGLRGGADIDTDEREGVPPVRTGKAPIIGGAR
jgi:hypothetical protein